MHTPDEATLAQLRAVLAPVMTIDDLTLGDPKDQYVVRFRGQLTMESQAAYAQVAAASAPLGFTPLFRVENQRHVVVFLEGVIAPKPSRTWINLVMFLLTILSTLFAGSLYDLASRHPELLTMDPGPDFWAQLQFSFRTMGVAAQEFYTGWPFALSLLLILGAHEMGHFIAARYHRVPVTWPYFIPFPLSLLGNMGAVIQLKAPPTNRRVLLDIGVAGPFAGFLVAVPVILIGLITSGPLKALAVDQVGGFEGNSLLYVLLKYAVFGQLLPAPALTDGLPVWLTMVRFYFLGIFPQGGGMDVTLNQVAWAGWGGLLVTGLNLLPAGQLDGGHALYVLVGKRATRLLPYILVMLLALSFFWLGWVLWAGLIYWLGQTHAEPLDQITELDPTRRALAVGALVLFVLVFMPIPLIQ